MAGKVGRWKTADGEEMTIEGMDMPHLLNAARFLRAYSKERPGLLPGISAYVGNDCANPREARNLAKQMEREARKRLRERLKSRKK